MNDRFNEAQKLLEESITINPESGNLKYALAQLFKKNNQRDNALFYLKLAMQYGVESITTAQLEAEIEELSL